MKSEQVEGVAEKLVGKAQGAVGRLLGDSKLEAEGAGRQASGQLTKTYGDALDNVSTFVREKPVAALAIGAVAALFISRILRR
ncbi:MULTISPECIES: CsbD family protein [Pseudomonas]|uniref:CsbD family protein n=2 Tax=Pseudomonas TaxID=286 RepID=A0ABX6HHJ8_9PSED|nr:MULTISPECIES: CsbD family protein [Pseudomonas]MBC3957186.1 CsbD family protein [Pseudomonas triticifolii]QHF05081.1 CsbD family protein [Pseudomonas asturiensis]